MQLARESQNTKVMLIEINISSIRSTLALATLSSIHPICTSSVTMSITHHMSCPLRVAPVLHMKEALSPIVYLSGYAMYKHHKNS